MKYKLMASYNCGISYAPKQWADNTEELKDGMDELNKAGMRWYIEKENGEAVAEFQCDIHKGIIDTMRRLNQQEEA